MYIAICDDDEMYAKIISGYLDSDSYNHPECVIYHSGEELIAAYKNSQRRPDVVFIDMEMQGMNGIDTANAVLDIDNNALIVFISAHTSYMQESFKCQPFRFLVKPVPYEAFRDTMREIRVKLDDRCLSLVINSEHCKVRVFLEDIILLESVGHFVLIWQKDNVYKARASLSDILKTIENDKFVRVHRAFAVNLKYIRVIDEKSVILYNVDRVIPISRSYKKNLAEAFMNYRESQYFI